MGSQLSPEKRLVNDILDTLPVTDRVFHDLRHANPLVINLLRTVRRISPRGRVLLVGPNETLVRSVLSFGYDIVRVDIPESRTRVFDGIVRRPGISELIAETATGRFDIIVLPYVLEGAAETPVDLLSDLRRWLVPRGRIVVASKHAGSVETRIAGALGQSTLTEPALQKPRIYLGWPSPPRRRVFDRREFRFWARTAGFAIQYEAPIIDAEATISINAMGIAEWARAELSHATKRALPLVRDCFVAVLAPLESAREEALPAEKGSRPRVTVVVRSHDPIRIGLVLQQLASQTYDADRLDAIVLHPAQDPLSLDPPPPIGLGVATLSHPDAYGPSGANAALREATGDIVGFTDDFCTIPQGWVESAALAMTGWTAAITGRVIIDRGSAAPFLTLPCSRPTENEEHLFPTANSFFSRRALLDVGGFDEGFRRSGRPVWGWDTAAAQRLEARGYATAFEESLYVFRRFPFPTRRDWVFEEFRLAADLPAATCRSPGLARAALHGALFASRRTMYFDLLVVSVAAAFATRRRFFVLGALPWLKAVSHFLDVWPPTEWPTSLRHLRGMTARHVVWLSGLVTGSLRSGRVVL